MAFYINDKKKFLAEVTDILDTYRNLIIQIKDKPVFKYQNTFRLAYARLLLSGKYNCDMDIAELVEQVAKPDNTDYDHMTYRQLFEHILIKPMGSGWQEKRENVRLPISIKPGHLYFDDKEFMQALAYLENYQYDEDLDRFEVRAQISMNSEAPYSCAYSFKPLKIEQKIEQNGQEKTVTAGTGAAQELIRQYELLRYGNLKTDFNDPRAVAESVSYLRFQTGLINLMFKPVFGKMIEEQEFYGNDDSDLPNRHVSLKDLDKILKYLKDGEK